ncbi:MAG: NAD(P)/FAD-dependent oxidoreductase [Spirochaetota bacterium]
MEHSRVLVVGGGFAGIQAVTALTKRVPGADITLVDRNGYATMVPALPDVLSGRVALDALTRPLSDVVAPSVTVAVDEVQGIDLDQRSVSARAGTYNYDYLVLAHGSGPRFFGFEPEDGTLHTVHTLERATAFRTALEARFRQNPDASVVIVGAGYTGLEVAACLSVGLRDTEVRAHITIVELADTILSFLTQKERSRIVEYFESIGVEIRTGTSLTRFSGGTAELSDGTRIEDALVCWSAGMQAVPTEVSGAVDRTSDGRLISNEYLQLPAYPEVLAAGDMAALQKDGRGVRRAVNFAYYSGRRAGENVAAAISGKPPKAFRPVDLGWVIPLGEESVGRVFGALRVGGSLGLRMHYAMCAFRHFGGAEAGEFYKTSARLRRSPQPLAVPRDPATGSPGHSGGTDRPDSVGESGSPPGGGVG